MFLRRSFASLESPVACLQHLAWTELATPSLDSPEPTELLATVPDL
jgi:hypothetical protein